MICYTDWKITDKVDFIQLVNMMNTMIIIEFNCYKWQPPTTREYFTPLFMLLGQMHLNTIHIVNVIVFMINIINIFMREQMYCFCVEEQQSLKNKVWMSFSASTWWLWWSNLTYDCEQNLYHSREWSVFTTVSFLHRYRSCGHYTKPWQVNKEILFGPQTWFGNSMMKNNLLFSLLFRGPTVCCLHWSQATNIRFCQGHWSLVSLETTPSNLHFIIFTYNVRHIEGKQNRSQMLFQELLSPPST